MTEINIQDEVAKIHHQYGTSEKANYQIQLLFEKYASQSQPVSEGKTKDECKDEIARKNNFDSFEKAIRYTFNRELLQSEREFIEKIIDEAMEEYAQSRTQPEGVDKEELIKEVLNPYLDQSSKKHSVIKVFGNPDVLIALPIQIVVEVMRELVKRL